MKRYAVFGGNVYYAEGGFNDFCDDFESADEAESFADDQFFTNQWWHVVDMDTRQIVAKSDVEPYQ